MNMKPSWNRVCSPFTVAADAVSHQSGDDQIIAIAYTVICPPKIHLFDLKRGDVLGPLKGGVQHVLSHFLAWHMLQFDMVSPTTVSHTSTRADDVIMP